jgi:hypothetical protein
VAVGHQEGAVGHPFLAAEVVVVGPPSSQGEAVAGVALPSCPVVAVAVAGVAAPQTLVAAVGQADAECRRRLPQRQHQHQRLQDQHSPLRPQERRACRWESPTGRKGLLSTALSSLQPRRVLPRTLF